VHALSRERETGIALVMAMIVLIILTLLGVAAIRASRLELRMSNNSQSRLSALEQAQSLADTVVSNPVNIAIQPGTHYFFCFSSPAPYAPSNPPSPPFSSSGACANYTLGGISYTTLGTISLPSSAGFGTMSGVVNPLPRNTYAQVLRNDPEFVPSTAVRPEETSGRSYDFASFSVMAGYDNSIPQDGSGNVTSASQPAAGVSEVNEGLYVRQSKPTGVTYQ